MEKVSIKELFNVQKLDAKYLVSGWVRTKRASKNVTFISLNDGSCFEDIQIVFDTNVFDDHLKKINTGSSLQLIASLVKSSGSGQSFELSPLEIKFIGLANPEEYPLQPKAHSFEFLRENAHIRSRTKTFSSIFRLRHAISYSIHNFFHTQGFYYINTPIITQSDAEGAGEMFRVTTLPEGEKDFSTDFFGKKTHLTVSGQLEAELVSLGLGKVYTFGPTFRAENSNTSRHLAEFWMIEPEIAFCDLDQNINLAQSLLKHVINYVLKNYKVDIEFLNKCFIKRQSQLKKDERDEMDLVEKLTFVVNNNFEIITYNEAFKILKSSKKNKKGKFVYQIDEWGVDFQSEHEKYLVEKVFKKPVVITDYPKKIKAFYMRQNDDGETVRAMDVLMPGIGEVIGGSQREERLDYLMQRMNEMDIPKEELWWYLDTRKFGTTPHSGFGLGLERLVQFITGMQNIRDVIPFPRTPNNVEF